MATRAELKAQTREALILAGITLFQEQGLDAPSLDAICEAAGKTRGAFYVHFEDREAFQVAVMERILHAYLAGCAALVLIAIADHLTDAGGENPLAVLVRNFIIPEGHYRGMSNFDGVAGFTRS